MRLLEVIGSVRPGRVGLPVGEWFAERARAHGGFELDLVDLAVLDLPFLDEPRHPRLQDYAQEHTKRWSATVQAADAVVLVTSEYNYGYPPALKNALDFVSREWTHKPVGFVSYGGVAAGTRAVQQLKQVVQSVGMYAVQPGVAIPFVATHMRDDGARFEADEPLEASVVTMLDELAAVGAALAPLRSARAG